MKLSATQRAGFGRDGYLCPLRVMTEDEAKALRGRLEALEKAVHDDPDRMAILRNDSNWVIPMFDEIARQPGILDAVESVLGPDILALHVDLFVKEPGSPKFISWHQDLHYWGLDSDNEVTAWLALSPATRRSGCMRFVPGSHLASIEHRDTYAGDNMLTRGQQADITVDEDRTVWAELQPGEISLHHGRILHASCANESDDRRIGVAVRYVSPEMSMADKSVRIGASLVRGRDEFGNFELVDAPEGEFESAAMKTWRRLREIEESILYAGADRAVS